MGRLITIGGVAPVVHGSRSSTRSPCKCPNWWNWKTASAHSHPDGSHTNPLALVDGFVLEDLRLCSAWVCWSGRRNRDRGRVPALGTVPPASLGAAAAGAAAIVLAIAAGTMVHHPATSRSAVCHGCEAQSHCWCPPHMRVHSLQQIAHCSAYAAPSSRSRADQIPAVGSRWIPHSNPMAYQPDISG